MLDNVLILCLFMGMIATVISLLSPLFLIYWKVLKIVREQREYERIMAKHDRALQIYEELKAQGRV